MAYRNIAIALSTNVGQFNSQMALASAAVFEFGRAAYGVANKVEAFGKRIGRTMVVAGGSVFALAGVAAKSAAELETALQNVATIWDESGQRAAGTFLSLADAGGQVLDLSTQLPQSATELAGALYDVASSGFQGTDAMTVMAASAKAAAAGLTTADVAARGITAVLNAYGDGAGKASHISDVLFQTVNLGVVSFEELAGVMGDFVGMSATAGVSIEEANAALATMTLAGISAAEASTSLNRVMQEFIQPSESLDALLKSMGHETGVLALEQRGLHGILTDVAQVVGADNVEAFATLFPEIRAVRGVLALLAGDGENYGRVVGSLTDETQLYGATQEALNKQSESTAFQLTVLKNTITALGTEFGAMLLPTIKTVAGVLQDFVAGVRALPDSIKTGIAIMVGFASAMTVLAGLYIAHKAHNLVLALLLKATAWSMNALGISTLFAARAMNALKIAMGVIGGVLAVASIAMVVFGKSQEDTGAQVDELKDTLDQQTGAIEAGTAAWVRDKAVKEGWLEAANELGVNSDDLTAALLGEEDAIDRVNAARQGSVDAAYAAMLAEEGGVQAVHDAHHALVAKQRASEKLDGAVKKTTKSVKDASKAVLEDVRASKKDKDAINALSTAAQAEQATAIARAEAHLKATEVMTKEINEVFNLADAYQAASDELNKVDETRSDTGDRARRDRQRAQNDALDDEIEAETEAADERGQIRQNALEDQQDAETRAFEIANRDFERARDVRRRVEDDAFEESSRARTQALEDQQEIEENALDKILRAQKNAFEDQARVRRDAHNDAMEELRDQNDERLEEEEEAWAVRKQQIQNLIDDTFGTERQGWQAVLASEKDAHEDRLDTIEEEGDRLVRTETNAFDDRARTQEDAFADQENLQKDALGTRHDNEKQALADDLAAIKRGTEDRRRVEDQAWQDLVDLDAGRMADRHEAQRTALDKDLALETEHMTDRHEERKRGLELIQQAEDDAADTRVAKSKEKHPVTMAALLEQVDDQLEQRRQMNRDLILIAEQGGADVNSTTLAKLAELGPEAVRVVAASGPDAIRALAKAINEGVTAVDTDALGAGFNTWGEAIGEGVTEGFLNNFLETMSHPLFGGPEGADKLRMEFIDQGWLPGFGISRQAVRPNAEGHFAQIAPAGSWRLWAEPETGGEAYIPLARSKAARSTSILAQVAGHFGYGLIPMAAGGISGASSGPAGWTVSMPIHVEARVDAGIDMGVAGRVIGDQVERGVRAALGELERRVVVKAWRN